MDNNQWSIQKPFIRMQMRTLHVQLYRIRVHHVLHDPNRACRSGMYYAARWGWGGKCTKRATTEGDRDQSRMRRTRARAFAVHKT